MIDGRFVTLVDQERIALEEQKDTECDDMEVPLSEVPLQDGFGAFFDFWSELSDHGPKYSKLKEEITQNVIYRVSLSAFDKAYQKALYLLNHSEVIRKMKSVSFSYNNAGYKYGIDGATPMDLTHILAVVLYTEFSCNFVSFDNVTTHHGIVGGDGMIWNMFRFDTLAFHLKGTFKRLSFIESHQKLLSRNAEYYHWSKTLIESVNCFGMTVEETETNVFYHGATSNGFDALRLKLNCPISTTSRLHVEQLYAREDGIILSLSMGQEVADRALRFLDCTLFSSWPFEQERLFMSPPAALVLNLQSVYHMASSRDYRPYLDAMRRLEEVVQGINVRGTVTESDLKFMTMLMEMEPDGNGNKVPFYVMQSFQLWTASKKKVVLDIGRLNHSYPAMKRILMEKESVCNLVALDRVSAVFRECESIECRHIGRVDVPTYIPLLISILEKLNEVDTILDTIHLNNVCPLSSPLEHSLILLVRFVWNINNIQIDNAYAFAANFKKVQSAICKQHWKIEHEVTSLIISRCRSSCTD